MPFIEESDLLELHKDIDKAQIINERLLDQIKFKNKELKAIPLNNFRSTVMNCKQCRLYY